MKTIELTEREVETLKLILEVERIEGGHEKYIDTVVGIINKLEKE